MTPAEVRALAGRFVTVEHRCAEHPGQLVSYEALVTYADIDERGQPQVRLAPITEPRRTP